jgi:solute carrier family 25 uncoupling protein 27
MSSTDHFTRFIASGTAAGLAEIMTIPADVIKVRLQLQHTAAPGSTAVAKYSGFTDCFTKICKQEHVSGLWKGGSVALLRQVCYSSLSLVLYEPIRNGISKQLRPNGTGHASEASFFERLCSGGLAGGISIACFNWTEVLKTQVQASSEKKSVKEIFFKILNKDGIRGFNAGIQPNVIRTFIVNATELGVYDQVKTTVMGPIFGVDSVFSHLGACTVAGVASACTSTPADVIKTRLMNQAGGNEILQPGETPYKGFLNTGARIHKEEGMNALYKGFTPIVVRKTIWCIIFFMSYEQIRLKFGAEN